MVWTCDGETPPEVVMTPPLSLSLVKCPACGVEQKTDWVGFAACIACGHCEHLSRVDGVCETCGHDATHALARWTDDGGRSIDPVNASGLVFPCGEAESHWDG